MLTSRKKLVDRTVNVRDATICVIATEGEKTEKQYFDLFKNPKVSVRVLSTEEEDHLSAPHHVLSRLDRFKQNNDLGEDDTLWLMIDVDHRKPEELAPICQTAMQKGFQLAISNPCFELWLFLHLFDPEMDDTRCGAIEARLKQRLNGYNKTKLKLDVYRPNVQDAIRRAKALHTNPEERWPAFPGTHVYKVVETLL